MDSSTEMEVRMVDQACQTELLFASNSPQKLKSIPLADVRHALLHDHSYARDLSYEQAATKAVTDVPKAKRALDFTETETLDVFEIECKTEVEIGDHEWMLSDMSDSDE